METTLVLAFSGAVIGMTVGVVYGVIESKQREASKQKSINNIFDVMKHQKENQELEGKLVYSMAILLGLTGASIGATIGLLVEYTPLFAKNTYAAENVSSIVEENNPSTLEITSNNKFIFSTPRLQ